MIYEPILATDSSYRARMDSGHKTESQRYGQFVNPIFLTLIVYYSPDDYTPTTAWTSFAHKRSANLHGLTPYSDREVIAHAERQLAREIDAVQAALLVLRSQKKTIYLFWPVSPTRYSPKSLRFLPWGLLLALTTRSGGSSLRTSAVDGGPSP